MNAHNFTIKQLGTTKALEFMDYFFNSIFNAFTSFASSITNLHLIYRVFSSDKLTYRKIF